jgi:hypothetical protein
MHNLGFGITCGAAFGGYDYPQKRMLPNGVYGA